MKKKPKLDPNVVDACPHCGKSLSSWEQVLLSVDHALICKGCWYRILLNPFDDAQQQEGREPG
jgi:hypothetical protein